MAILRTDIERALDELTSQEEGMRFQGLAVVLGKKRWPELIARQRKKDLGLDAYAPANLTPETQRDRYPCRPYAVGGGHQSRVLLEL